MTTPSVSAKTASRRRTLIVVVIFLSLVAVAFWAVDGWLLARLRIIANDTFTAGDPLRPGLFGDAHEELKAVAPNRLARLLHVPSPQIRSVICLSLAERERDYKSLDGAVVTESWAGVLPRLLHAAQKEADPVARQCAIQAVRSMPTVPVEDVELLFGFAATAVDNDDEHIRSLGVDAVHKLAKWHPERMPQIVALLQSWCDGANKRNRVDGFRSLVTLTPDAPETLAVFRKAMEAGDPDGAGDGRWMLGHHPELIDEFLAGNTAQRRLLHPMAYEQVSESRYRNPARPPPKIHFDEKRLRLIDAEYEKLFSPTTANDAFARACRYFQCRPEGPTLLLTKALRLTGANRATAIIHASSHFNDAARVEPFLNDLARFLRDDFEAVRTAAAGVLRNSLQSAKSRETAFAEKVRDLLRAHFDAFPQDGTAYAMFLFVDLPNPRADDVDRYAAAVLYSLKSHEELAAKGSMRTGSWEVDQMKKWLIAHPNLRERPSIKSVLARHEELLRRGIVYQPPAK